MKDSLIKARSLPGRGDSDNLDGVKRQLRDFRRAGSGGQRQYSGHSMPEAHCGMNVHWRAYMAAIDGIPSALDQHQIDEQARKDVPATACSLKYEIVRV